MKTIVYFMNIKRLQVDKFSICALLRIFLEEISKFCWNVHQLSANNKFAFLFHIYINIFVLVSPKKQIIRA